MRTKRTNKCFQSIPRRAVSAAAWIADTATCNNTRMSCVALIRRKARGSRVGRAFVRKCCVRKHVQIAAARVECRDGSAR